MIRLVSALLVLLFASLPTGAAEKQFQREYTYRASDDDSKNSARESAVKELRSELLREIGVYIESYLEIESISDQKGDRDYIREEIKQITAGTVETKILDERWDGSRFFVEAIVTIDPDNVVESVNRALENRSASAELARMLDLLSSKDADLAARSAELASAQRSLDAKKAELAARSAEMSGLRTSLERQRQELRSLQSKLAELNAEQAAIRSKRNRILHEINNASKKAETMLYEGMTLQDVISTFGPPRSRSDCGENVHLNYGRKWLMFEGGVIRCRIDSNEYRGYCSSC